MTIGFTARVDESLRSAPWRSPSGQRAESIVDITSTSASVAFTQEILDSGRAGATFITSSPWRSVTQATMDVAAAHCAAAGHRELRQESRPAPVRRHDIAMGADQNTPSTSSTTV